MNGLWIAADEKPAKTTLYYFKKTFTAKAGARMHASVCADHRYRLWVNGHYVCDGPCAGSQYRYYYEEPDITPYLVNGENEMVAEVLFLTVDMFISIYKGPQPAFWFRGVLEEGGAMREICSDETWLAFRNDSRDYIRAQHVHPSMPPVEIVHAPEKTTPVAVKALYEAHPQRKSMVEYGLGEKYMLYPRQIPIITPDKPQGFRVVKEGSYFVELDAGGYTTAWVRFCLSARPGTRVTITYAECYGDEKHKKNIRDDSHGVLWGISDAVVLGGEEYTFAPFWYRAFRFIRIEADGEFSLNMEKSCYCNYFLPFEENGRFETNDDRINAIWRISKNTVKCCTHETYVDCPAYEQQQYDMDSCLEALFTYRMTDDTRIQRKSLTDLAHSQLPDGMLQANYPSTTVQVIPAFSIYWVMMLRDYLLYTGDKAFVRQMTGVMDRVLEGMEALRDERGLVGYSDYWQFIDWVDGWQNGVPSHDWMSHQVITANSMIYAAGLLAAAQICEAVDRHGLAADYRARNREINAAINRFCYDEKKGMYQDRPGEAWYSEHTAVWAILSENVVGEEATRLMERALREDVSRCSFSMNYFVFRALEKSHCYRYAPMKMQGWQTMLDRHCTSWCENPGDCRSECHGWSSAPIYEFTGMVLGVQPEGIGFSSVRIKPEFDVFDEITWAKGTVPTPHGLIAVAWEKKDGKTHLKVELPPDADMPLTLVLPTGEMHTKEKKIDLIL